MLELRASLCIVFLSAQRTNVLAPMNTKRLIDIYIARKNLQVSETNIITNSMNKSLSS